MNFPDPTMVMLVGLPGSGKSTYAATLRAKYPDIEYICPDQLRHELTGDINDQSRNHYIFSKMVPALVLKASLDGKDILYDGTNINVKNRRGVLEQAKSLGYKTEVHVLLTSLEDCLSRNAARDRVVPAEVIHKMHSIYQAPDQTVEPEIDKIVRLIGVLMSNAAV